MTKYLEKGPTILAAAMRLRTRLALRCRPASITKRVLQFVDERTRSIVGHRIAGELLSKNYPCLYLVRGLRALAFPIPVLVDTAPANVEAAPNRPFLA